MICKNCGSEIMDGSKFCINCGAKVEEEVSAADTGASIDETLDSAQEAYEQAASDLSDTADQAANESLGNSDSGSGFYESNETYTDYSNDTVEESNGNIGFAIASLICGCLSILCCFAGCVSWILSIVAIVLGIITVTKKYDGRGYAIAGIITGGVGILISIVATIAIFSAGILDEMM